DLQASGLGGGVLGKYAVRDQGSHLIESAVPDRETAAMGLGHVPAENAVRNGQPRFVSVHSARKNRCRVALEQRAANLSPAAVAAGVQPAGAIGAVLKEDTIVNGQGA